VGSIEKSGVVRKFDRRAQVHDEDPVANRPNDRQVVRDEDDRQAVVFLFLSKYSENLLAHGTIERGNGFVTDKHLGLEYQRSGNRNALRLPARKFVRKPVEIARTQPHLLKKFRDALASFARRHTSLMHDQRLRNNICNAHLRVQRSNRILEDQLHSSSRRHRAVLYGT
jgi:hypothetical protein